MNWGKLLYLASWSPRRAEILDKLNLDYKIMVPNYKEDINSDLSYAKLVEKLSYGKAHKVFQDIELWVVLGADTFVVCDSHILGKPKDEKQAFEYLSMISWSTLEVYTGIAIIQKDNSNIDKYISNTKTKVQIKILKWKEIQDYINTKEPLDKAWAFAIQGLGGCFIEYINWSYSAVMWLDISKVYEGLKSVGYNILD